MPEKAKIDNDLTQLLGIDFPVIMAPMFLVSNEEMMKSAMRSGIAGAFPTLNFRKDGELESVLDNLNKYREGNKSGTYGVNLIVQKTNYLYQKHLKVCIEKKVPFYITSLGNPSEVIQQSHAYGAKVFCDVTNTEHAKKVFDQGCDGFVAVGQGAGGHAGPYPLHILVASLKKNFPGKPVIAAGGIATGAALLSVLAAGASGASIGTRFIASDEAGVNDAYKNAVVKSHMNDIVLTTRLSGTPCTIINTPEAKKMGYEQNRVEKFLSKNPRTKKWFKMLVQYRGLKNLERSVSPASYHTLWCAGQSVEMIDKIMKCEEIVDELRKETFEAQEQLSRIF